jgi:hypothetical protein
MGRGPTPDAGQDFSGEATNPGYAGLSNAELGGLGVPGYENYAGPGERPPSLWDKLMGVAGKLGTTPGAAPGPTTTPGGSRAMGAPPPPMQLPGNMPTPRGMGAYFQALQNPPASGGNLMAQYAALQQLMRGS